MKLPLPPPPRPYVPVAREVRRRDIALAILLDLLRRLRPRQRG